MLAAFPRAARADEPRRLRYDVRSDAAVTAVGGIWWLSSELLKAQIVPEKCRWCYRAEDGADLLNPYDGWMRRRLLWKNPNTAGHISDVLGFFVQPTLAIGLNAIAAVDAKSAKDVPVDGMLVVEATVLAADVNQLAKFFFARERPFVHFLPRAPDAVRAFTTSPSDDNLSFFSGHTTLSFALATSAGTIASMRGYRLAPLTWGVGLANAFTIGYLRIGADKHYFSDVTIGALVGAAIGIGVPLIFHSPSDDSSANPPSASVQALAPAPMRTVFSTNGSF